jgi:tripartite-type tricarboxylate transporter receptor subunit TctC
MTLFRQIFTPLLLLPLLMSPAGTIAQDSFPSKPITLYMSFTDTGSSSRVARVYAPKLEKILGQPVEIRYHQPGKGGNIGAEAAAAAPPDGHSMLIGTVGNISLLPAILPDYGINPLSNLVPVTQIAVVPNLLAVRSEIPVETLDEFIDHAKMHPGEITYSYIAPWSIHRLEFRAIIAATGIDMTHTEGVRGSMPTINGIIDGKVDTSITTSPHWIPLLEDGQVRVLAVLGEERHPAYPELPTMLEAGIDMIPRGSWDGVFVPAGTPEAAIDVLYEAFSEVARDPEVIEAVEEQGMFIRISESPAAFREFVESETLRIKETAEKLGPWDE